MPRPTGELAWQRKATSKKPNQPLPGAWKRRARKGRSRVRGNSSTFALLAAGFFGVWGMSGPHRRAFAVACCAARSRSTTRPSSIRSRMLIGAGNAGRKASARCCRCSRLTGLAALAAPMALGGWLLVDEAARAEVRPAQSDRGLGKIFSINGPIQLGMSLAEDARRRRHRRLGDLESPQGRNARRSPPSRSHLALADADASDRRVLRHDDRRHVRWSPRSTCRINCGSSHKKLRMTQGRSEARAPRKRRRSARQGPDSPAAARRSRAAA